MAIIGLAGLTGRVIVDIPFDFTVGNKELKAGRYAVSRITPNGPNGTLLIRNEDDHAAANFNVNGVTSKDDDSNARLVFNRYGKQYFLSQIFDGAGKEGYKLMKSKSEREAAKKGDTITQNVVAPQVVTVAARIER
jgi:hypothetical protein